MPTSCDQVDSRTRKNLTAILNGLARVGQTTAAEAINRDESTVSKMKDKELPQLARLLAACGLKVVPVTVKCYEPDFIAAIFHIAKGRLTNMERADELEWEGGQ